MTIDLHPHIACPRPSASGAPRRPGGRLRTPGRLKGWAAASALAVPLASVPVVLAPTPLPAQSAASVRPSPPRPLPVAVGDTEALLTWTAGGPGVGGVCTATSYYVDILEPNGSLVAASPLLSPPASGTLQWFVDGLAPATAYRGEITAYGAACDGYSTGTVALTTTGASASSDPTAPAGNAKQRPFPVRTLRNQVSGTSATVTWGVPRADASPHRCRTSTPPAYGWYLYDETADKIIKETNVDGRRSQTFSGLTPGTKYVFRVFAYSAECDAHSVSSEVAWTQPPRCPLPPFGYVGPNYPN